MPCTSQLSIMKRPRVSPSMNGIHVPHAAENSAGTVSVEGERASPATGASPNPNNCPLTNPQSSAEQIAVTAYLSCNWETHQSTVPLHQNNSLEYSRLVCKGAEASWTLQKESGTDIHRRNGHGHHICRDLARTQQKGGGGLTFLAFHCNHIKLKKGSGRRGAE